MEVPAVNDRMLRRRELIEFLGISLNHFYALRDRDPRFPRPYYLGKHGYYRLSEVENYLQSVKGGAA